MWASALLVVASLLVVVAGDSLVAEGQVRLSTMRSQVAAAEGAQKAAQVEVAEKAAPPVVVAQAKTQGLVAPQMVVYLPQVPLNVPLPVPQTAPPPRQAVSPSILLGRRSRAMRLVLALVFITLAARLISVQELGHQRYASLASSQLTQTVSIPAVRGGIYDRNGEVLAESVTKQTVVADPLLIAHPTTTAEALSPVLGIPPDQLRAELTEPSGFVYLAHRVPDPVAAKVNDLDLTGINLVPETQRVEPDGQLALPLVGRVGWNGGGTSGFEYQYQSLLAGTAGSENLLEAPDGATLPGSTAKSTPARPGTGLELTVDESVQYVAEQALGAEIAASHATGGTAVVMDVKTGDILAMADLRPTTGIGHHRLPPLPPLPDHCHHCATVDLGSDPGVGGRHAPGGRGGGTVEHGGHPGLRAGFGVQTGHLFGGPGRRADQPQPGARGAGLAPHGHLYLPRRRGPRHRTADRHPDPRPVVQHRHHRGGPGAG